MGPLELALIVALALLLSGGVLLKRGGRAIGKAVGELEHREARATETHGEDRHE